MAIELEEARRRIGAWVVYVPRHGACEDGTIVSAGKEYVMVRYPGGGAKATRPEDLEWGLPAVEGR